MHRIFYLAKILRQSGSGDDGSGKVRKSSNIAWLIIGIFVAVGLIALGVFAGKLPVILGEPIAFVKSLFFVGTIFAIIFSLPGFINNLYMANDLQVLLTLPYKPTEITAAKVINSCDMVIGTVIVTTLPFQITYGIVNHMTAGYYLAILLALICIPIIVISFISIVIMAIMYFVNGLKNKDTLKIIGGVLAFAVIVAFVLVINGGSKDAEKVAAALAVVGRVSNILPINFALESLINGVSFLAIIECIVITAAFLVLFIICAAKLYIPGALSIQETSANGKTLSDAKFAEVCKQKSVFKAYFTKDLRHVRREPAYLMSGWLYTIFYPAVMLIIYVFALGQSNLMSLDSITDTASAVAWVTGVSLFVTYVAASTNAISCSCMSREGESIMLLKQSPVSYKTVLKAKMMVSVFVCSLGSTTYVVIGGIILSIMGYIPIWTVLYGLVLNVCTIFFVVGMCMMHDIKKPTFTWETEAGMIKKCAGASSVVMMLLGIFVPIFIMIAGRFVGNYYWALIVFFVVLCAVMAITRVASIYKKGVEKMMKY